MRGLLCRVTVARPTTTPLSTDCLAELASTDKEPAQGPRVSRLNNSVGPSAHAFSHPRLCRGRITVKSAQRHLNSTPPGPRVKNTLACAMTSLLRICCAALAEA